MSGYLDATFFSDELIVEAAIELAEEQVPKSMDAYVPHLVRRVRTIQEIEYNGEV